MAGLRSLTINLKNLTVMQGDVKGNDLVTIISHKKNDYIEIIGNFNNKVINTTIVNRVKGYFVSKHPNNLLSSINAFIENLNEDDMERFREILPKLDLNDNVYQQIYDFFGFGLTLFTLVISGYVVDMHVFENIEYYLKHMYAKDTMEMISLILYCYISCHNKCEEYLLLSKVIEFINIFINGFDICVINEYNRTQLTISAVKCLISESTYPYRCKMDDVCNEYNGLNKVICNLHQEIKNLRCELSHLNKEMDCLRLKAECGGSRGCDIRPRKSHKVKHHADMTELANLNNPNITISAQSVTNKDIACPRYDPPENCSKTISEICSTTISESSCMPDSKSKSHSHMNKLKKEHGPRKRSFRRSLSGSEFDYYGMINQTFITDKSVDPSIDNNHQFQNIDSTSETDDVDNTTINSTVYEESTLIESEFYNC